MIPDHANPIRLPPPIGSPTPLPMTRDEVHAELRRMGFKKLGEDFFTEALACNPMKYRIRVRIETDDRPMLYSCTDSSWALALRGVRSFLGV